MMDEKINIKTTKTFQISEDSIRKIIADYLSKTNSIVVHSSDVILLYNAEQCGMVSAVATADDIPIQRDTRGPPERGYPYG